MFEVRHFDLKVTDMSPLFSVFICTVLLILCTQVTNNIQCITSYYSHIF